MVIKFLNNIFFVKFNPTGECHALMTSVFSFYWLKQVGPLQVANQNHKNTYQFIQTNPTTSLHRTGLPPPTCDSIKKIYQTVSARQYRVFRHD